MLDNIMVGKQIAFLRKQYSFTQDELAEKLGVSAQAVSKWENGHTLPETALLPLLAGIFRCSVDAILMPFSARDAAFQDFIREACGKYGELATKLYQKLSELFAFTVTYDEKFNVFDNAYNGYSAKFNIPDKDDFIIRIDVKAKTETDDNTLAVRIALQHCSGYIDIIDKMPEHIKQNFRVSDCSSCTCSCPYCMAYMFEGVEYKQCHFITITLNSVENMEFILALVRAEHEGFRSETGAK